MHLHMFTHLCADMYIQVFRHVRRHVPTYALAMCPCKIRTDLTKYRRLPPVFGNAVGHANGSCASQVQAVCARFPDASFMGMAGLSGGSGLIVNYLGSYGSRSPIQVYEVWIFLGVDTHVDLLLIGIGRYH